MPSRFRVDRACGVLNPMAARAAHRCLTGGGCTNCLCLDPSRSVGAAFEEPTSSSVSTIGWQKSSGTCTTILSESMCRERAESMGKTWGGVESKCKSGDCAPRGCYWTNSDRRKLFWNADTTGSCTKYKRCVCPASGALKWKVTSGSEACAVVDDADGSCITDGPGPCNVGSLPSQ